MTDSKEKYEVHLFLNTTCFIFLFLKKKCALINRFQNKLSSLILVKVLIIIHTIHNIIQVL